MAAPEDFSTFVATRRNALLRTAFLLTGGHQQDAEDLLQTALVKAVPAWSRIRGNPEPYVRRIMVHENVSRWRWRRTRPEVLTDTLPERAAPATSPGEDDELRRALAVLAPRQRAVIVLRYYEDLTERETAQLLGISIGTVKSQARDALTRLRALLPDLDPDPESMITDSSQFTTAQPEQTTIWR
ncbi:MAG: SigE family RNA polymerase sigma factor [Kineosporiaceae bacterium]